MSAPKIIYITPAPEGGFVEFWAEHPSAARGDVAYIPQKGATKMQAEIAVLKAELAALKSQSNLYPPCKGANCGCTDGVSHSSECFAEHEAAITGGKGFEGEA